jgi:hypothetical protein
MGVQMIAAEKCTSRPDCPCQFCFETRTTESARDEQDRIAEDCIRAYHSSQPDFHTMNEAQRDEYMTDRIMDREMRARPSKH